MSPCLCHSQPEAHQSQSVSAASHGPHCSAITKCVLIKPCVSPSPLPGLGFGLSRSQQTAPENRLGSGPSILPPTLHPASPTHPTPHTCSFQPCLPLPTLSPPHDACRSCQSVLPTARVVKNPFLQNLFTKPGIVCCLAVPSLHRFNLSSEQPHVFTGEETQALKLVPRHSALSLSFSPSLLSPSLSPLSPLNPTLHVTVPKSHALSCQLYTEGFSCYMC